MEVSGQDFSANYRKKRLSIGLVIVVLTVGTVGLSLYVNGLRDSDSTESNSVDDSSQGDTSQFSDTSFVGVNDASALENAPIDDAVDDAGRLRYYLGIAQDYLAEGDHESAARLVTKAREYSQSEGADQLEIAFVEMRIARELNDGSFSGKASAVASQLERQYIADKNANYSSALRAAGLYAEAGNSTKALELYNEVLLLDDSVLGAGELTPEEIRASTQESIDAL